MGKFYLKQDSGAKDSFLAPADPFPINRRLSNHQDLLAVQILNMDLAGMVIRKDRGSPVEM